MSRNKVIGSRLHQRAIGASVAVYWRMSIETETAQRYRVRAEEVRTIASDDHNLVTHDALMKIAADYERMANTLDAIDRTNQVLHKNRA